MRLIPTLVVATALGLSVLVPVVEAQGTARQRTLFVTAVGDDGMPLEKLAMEDVIVREDGVAREVLKVTPSAEPVDITLLVDNSIASTKRPAGHAPRAREVRHDVRRTAPDHAHDGGRPSHGPGELDDQQGAAAQGRDSACSRSPAPGRP